MQSNIDLVSNIHLPYLKKHNCLGILRFFCFNSMSSKGESDHLFITFSEWSSIIAKSSTCLKVSSTLLRFCKLSLIWQTLFLWFRRTQKLCQIEAPSYKLLGSRSGKTIWIMEDWSKQSRSFVLTAKIILSWVLLSTLQLILLLLSILNRTLTINQNTRAVSAPFFFFCQSKIYHIIDQLRRNQWQGLDSNINLSSLICISKLIMQQNHKRMLVLSSI